MAKFGYVCIQTDTDKQTHNAHHSTPLPYRNHINIMPYCYCYAPFLWYGGNMRYYDLSVCLSHTLSWKLSILRLWLLQNINRKPSPGSRTHWSTGNGGNDNEAAPLEKHSPCGCTIELSSGRQISFLHRDASLNRWTYTSKAVVSDLEVGRGVDGTGSGGVQLRVGQREVALPAS